MGRSNLPLSRALALQMTLVAIGVSLALMIFYALIYLFDEPGLSRLSLQAQLEDIASAMDRGDDPAELPVYKAYPRSYAFRVFDHRQAWQRKVVVAANVGLLSSLGATPDDLAADSTRDLMPDFGSAPAADGAPDDERWLMVDRREVGGKIYWFQAAMSGDPARLWMGALQKQLLDHVVFPVLFIVPPLTLAVYLTTRRLLRPLSRVARQAAALGSGVMTGEPLAPLSDNGLPNEFRDVVTAINVMLTKLDRSLTLQKEVTSDIAHELRTPLAVLLLEISQLPACAAKDRCEREIESLRELINQLLRFAQAEDAMVRECRSVDLAAAARRVCEDLAAVAFGLQKTIEFDAPDEGVMASGHPALIDAAIRNIVDNAVKLSPARSTISVGVDRYGNVRVDDRGPGVADEHKNLIFERFWRADGRRREGTGIGLALVRRIALLHGGDVRVEDRPGGGARFVLTLRAAAPV